MGKLLDKLIAAREQWVESKGFKFKLRRPHQIELARMLAANLTPGETIARVIYDWQNVKEIDLFPGGGSDLVPFERELWDEWIADHSEHWGAIMDVLNEKIQKYSEGKADAEKNSPAS